ncbi:MAG TPA: beta-ketoacyl-[acyl-carrier-protein] synthase family protein [Thermodesulfobacteriota bacterium]|nr:beta-ketoacyl-[acyl-carrier-protein] synthase family protein [Thermodesulfobacteriota bacterium]
MSGYNKRVVVTGVGPVTPVGFGKEAYWKSLIEGRSSFKRIEFPNRDMNQYRCQIAAPIEGFDPYRYIDRTKHSKHLGKTSQYAIAATRLALMDAGLTLEKNDEIEDTPSHREGQYQVKGLDPFQIGVILGVGAEAMELLEYYHERFMSRGIRGLSPFGLPNIYLSSIASHVAQSFTIRGTTFAISTACASATHAMINSFLQIQGGREDFMVTGGTDACITPLVFAGFDVLRAMSTRNDEPERACRPFDRERDGFVMGEGSGILIFEELDHAKERGAHIYAEVGGFGMTADAHHLTEPDPDGKALGKAFRDALQMGGVRPEEIDYINPHGTSTPLNDKVETKVIKGVFGKLAYEIPISSTKSITGHMMGAAGGVEAIAVLLTLERGMIHPTKNYEFPDPDCDLDYVPHQARKKEVRIALSASAGFGGVNSVLLFKKLENSASF